MKPTVFQKYKQNTDWGIQPGSEGKPTIITSFSNGEEITNYYSYGGEDFEPFLYLRRFRVRNDAEHYIDVSEEFILYFILYETLHDKQNRKYFFIDDVGDLEEVIVIEPKRVKIKLKVLIEYISVRQLHFSICFDFVRFHKSSFEDIGITPLDEDFENENWFYNHFIRSIAFIDAGKLQSWVRGKVLIKYDPKRTKDFYFDRDSSYEKFLIGYDNRGEEVYESCERNDANYFKLTYFKKAVLDKYYNEPNKYQVDGWSILSSFFTLKIDNHNEDYVAVFLTELRMLPHKEQLHWKQYNIPPQRE